MMLSAKRHVLFLPFSSLCLLENILLIYLFTLFHAMYFGHFLYPPSIPPRSFPPYYLPNFMFCFLSPCLSLLSPFFPPHKKSKNNSQTKKPARQQNTWTKTETKTKTKSVGSILCWQVLPHTFAQKWVQKFYSLLCLLEIYLQNLYF